MNKTLKTRRILLLIAFALMVLGVVVTAISQLREHKFHDEAHKALTEYVNKNNIGITLTETPSKIWLSSILAIAFGGFFYIFALIFIFGRNTVAQTRKWPYIVMIIFAVISVLFKLWGFVGLEHTTGPLSLTKVFETIDKSNVANPQDIKDAMTKIVADQYADYKNLLVIFHAIIIVLSAAQLVLHITQLVLIKKSKNRVDQDYSQQIIKAAKHNELP